MSAAGAIADGGPAAVVDEVGAMVSLPAAAARVCALADDPAATIAMFESVVLTDVALTARLLKLANSPAIGLSHKVGTVSRAVTVLGMRAVRDLALGVAAVHSFDRIPSSLMTMQDFWTHSMLSGLAARELALRAGRRVQAESAFVEGLMHAVGQLLLFRARPEQARTALLAWADDPDDAPLLEHERRVLGFTHCEVGAVLAQRWNLPSSLAACIEFYGEPARAGAYQAAAAQVAVADRLATLAQIESTDLGDVTPIPDAEWRMVGVDPACAAEVVVAARDGLAEVRGLLQ